VSFKANISYLFRRQEKEISGSLCSSCATRTFAAFELQTLVGTWWGIIGCIVGPICLLHNITEYVVALLGFAFKGSSPPIEGQH
jgi:hypothetical protein